MRGVSQTENWPGINGRTVTRWLPDYAIGVHEVDAEHQALFALAEQLFQGILSRQDHAAVRSLLEALIDDTCQHFTNEEQLMERIGYPHYPDHCREHQELRLQVFAMRNRYVAGEIGPVELLQFVIEWLKGHTTTSDRRIGNYMRKHGMVS